MNRVNTYFDRFFLQILGGIIMMLILAMVIRWYLEPLVIIWTKALAPVIGFNAYKILNLNYVVLGLLVGVLSPIQSVFPNLPHPASNVPVLS